MLKSNSSTTTITETSYSCTSELTDHTFATATVKKVNDSVARISLAIKVPGRKLPVSLNLETADLVDLRFMLEQVVEDLGASGWSSS
jgi:hypothetical protein